MAVPMYSIFILVFNEEAVISETYKRLKNVMDLTGEEYELLFINDGIRDRTASILKEYSYKAPFVKVIDFSRDFGHQIAIIAGMEHKEHKITSSVGHD